MKEYDVSYATKEWLMRKGWFIVVFNPPGSQGTFTIPNPAKTPNYRGQTGSVSPDIIAYKRGTLFVIESKPLFNKQDVLKLVNLIRDKQRLNLLIRISERICFAHKIKMSPKPTILIGKAHSGVICPMEGIQTFITTTKAGWNPDRIDPSKNPFSFMEVTFYPDNENILKII